MHAFSSVEHIEFLAGYTQHLSDILFRIGVLVHEQIVAILHLIIFTLLRIMYLLTHPMLLYFKPFAVITILQYSETVM